MLRDAREGQVRLINRWVGDEKTDNLTYKKENYEYTIKEVK